MVSIINGVILRCAVVVAENLLVQITEHVERIGIDISSLQAPLEQAPEVLQSVRRNATIDVLFRRVNDLVRESCSLST